MILILMKRFFRKIRSVYRKNPPAYLSLAVIAISLTIGASVSSLGLIPQILRLEGRSGNCSRFIKASDCQSTPRCLWIPRKRTKCGFNAKGKCPAGCQYTPAQTQTLKCSDIKQRQACTPPCHWQSQTTRGECLEETSKPCSPKDCDDKKKGCWLKNTSSCSCTKWKNDFQGCTKNGCDWVKQTTCAGRTPTCAKWQITKQGSCSGGSSQQTSSAKKCQGFYYSNPKCVSRAGAPTTSPTPSPSLSDDSSPSPSSECNPHSPNGFFIAPNGEARQCKPTYNCSLKPGTDDFYICVDSSDANQCDPSKNTIGSDGLLYSECSPDDPRYSCQPDSDSPKGGYCHRRGDHPPHYNPQSECNPFAQLYGSDSPTTRCDSIGYNCSLKPGTDDFYICVNVVSRPDTSNRCNPNNTTRHPELGILNTDCYYRHHDENMVCVRLPKPNNHLFTCQSSTSDESLKPCEDIFGFWYTHGSIITQQGEECNHVGGKPTGYEIKSQLCDNGQWKNKDVAYVDSADCPQVASCKMYDLNDSAQQKLFKEGKLHCCGKVVNYLDTKNNYGQTYRDYYNAICKPKEESQTSFWESLKEIF